MVSFPSRQLLTNTHSYLTFFWLRTFLKKSVLHSLNELAKKYSNENYSFSPLQLSCLRWKKRLKRNSVFGTILFNKGEKGTLICAANDEDEEAQRKSIWRRRGKAFSFNEKFTIQQQLPLCCIWLVFDALRLASSIPVNKRQKALWHKHTTIVNLWMNYILHW